MAGGLFVPQMVAPVDTSGLAALGQRIGEWRQESAIADVMKGLDPSDPNSMARVTQDLYARGDRASRDAADRLLGVFNQQKQAEATREIQSRHAGVAERGLALREKQYGTEQSQQKAIADELRKMSQGEGGGLGGIPPSAAPAAPAAPAARPRVSPGEVDYWDKPTSEEGGPPVTSAAPASLFSAPAPTQTPAPRAQPARPGTVASLPLARANAPLSQEDATAASRTAMGGQYDPTRGPLPAGGPQAASTAPTPEAAAAAAAAPTAAAAVPSPQQLFPGPAGPMADVIGAGVRRYMAPAAEAAPVRTAEAAAEPAEAEPAEAEELPSAETPRTSTSRTYTPRQIQLRRENHQLANIGAMPGASAGTLRSIDRKIAENNAEFSEIEAFRSRGEKTREKLEQAEGADEIKRRGKLAETVGKEMRNNIGLRDNLKALERTINSPNYPGGALGQAQKWGGGAAIAVDNMLKNFGFGGLQGTIGEDAWQRWVQDPVTRGRTAEKLSNAITLQTLGGSLGQYISNTDRNFARDMNANFADDPKSAGQLIKMRLAEIARHDEMHTIVTQGIAQKKTATQIEARLRRFGQENPLYEKKPLPGEERGEPTALGRMIDPDGARKWDAEQKAKAARAAEAEAQYGGYPAGQEAAVVGGRPTPAQIRATREFDAAVKEVPGRPVTGAGSSRASDDPALFTERGEGTKEAVRDFFRGPGRLGYGAEGVPAPQRAGEGIDLERGDMGPESIRGIMEQGSRLAPGGIPIESMRRSTNIERRPEPNEAGMPLVQQQMFAADWLRDAANQPVGALSRAAGLADLEAQQYNRRPTSIPTAGVPGPLPPPSPLPLPPLPRPKPRRKEEKKR